MEKIDGHDAYRVVGVRPDGSAVDRLYFDAQTGLLCAPIHDAKRHWSIPEETNYDDYRDVTGSRFPTRCES